MRKWWLERPKAPSIKISKAETEEIRSRYAAGESMQHIADVTGRHYNAIRNLLARVGDRPTNHKLTEEEKDELLRLYASGVTFAELEQQYGVQQQRVWAALRSRGALTRSEAEAHVRKLAASLYNDGKSFEEIAAELGISRFAVIHLVNQAGICFRKLPPVLSTADLKRMASEHYAAGLSFAAVSNLVKKDVRTVRAWVEEAGIESRRQRKGIRLDFS